MSRDDEADRYELRAERQRHAELGKLLYEKRRPGGRPWAELDEDGRTQWTLLAVDDARSRGEHEPVQQEPEDRLALQIEDEAQRHYQQRAFAAPHAKVWVDWAQLSDEEREPYRKTARELILPVVTSGTTATVAAQVQAVDTEQARDAEQWWADRAELERQWLTEAKVEQARQQLRQQLRDDPELRRGVKAILARVEALSDEQDAAEPHCLLVTDPQTKKSWVIGGFRNRLHAQVAIPLIEARYRQADPDFVFTYTPMIFEKPPWESDA